MNTIKIIAGLALCAGIIGASVAPRVASAHGGKHHDFTVTIDSKGFHPATVKVAAGKEVHLTFVSKEASCANAFSIPSLGRTLKVAPGKKKMIEFTPKKGQTLAFVCTMNMFKGKVVTK